MVPDEALKTSRYNFRRHGDKRHGDHTPHPSQTLLTTVVMELIIVIVCSHYSSQVPAVSRLQAYLFLSRAKMVVIVA